ncbi:MAG: hypothetical protein MRZ79_18755 [Bacteroidia bacterium]|nr:hypothetical protein [Bacteroidia bacterium]
MKRIFQIISLLSLDVVVGSLASAILVLLASELEMPWAWWVVLAISVWVIYTTDHLMDAYRLKENAHTRRHLFHHQNFNFIGFSWIFLILAVIGLVILYLPVSIILFGMGMGLLVLIHLGLVWMVGNKTSIFLQKELGVGLIYSLGIWGGPFAYHQIWPGISVWLIFGQFFLLAMMNLLIFSSYEANTDELDGHTSLALAMGKKRIHILVRALLGIIILTGICLLIWQNKLDTIAIQLVFLAMGCLLLWINEKPEFFRINERYRFLGDGVFFIPFTLLFLP